MDKRFFTNLGNDIKKATESKDFSQLGQNISDTVNQTVNDVLNSVQDAMKQVSAGPKVTVLPKENAEKKPQWNYAHPNEKKPVPVRQTSALSKKGWRMPDKSNLPGTLLSVAGGILTPLSVITYIWKLMDGSYGRFFPFSIAMVSACLFGVILAAAGSSLRGRYRRCRDYLILAGNAGFVSVEQLASATGRSQKFVAKDLSRMIRGKMIKNAHLDDQGTCLMLDNATYQQYLQLQRSIKDRQAEEERIRLECEADPQRAELYRTVQEGKDYIRQIKEANDAIPGEEISEKLFRLENVITRIFDHVEKHPEKLPEISKFLRYYLPTTLKLVNAYRDFEKQPVQGENICKAKEEICTSLDTINTSFENLLDSLFEDDALDISTDISVLHTMLAQEGLTGSDFSKDKTNT